MSIIKKINQGALLLDVRTESEYQEVHVSNSRLLPLDDLSQADLGNREQEIFIHCALGGRAEKAKQMLEAKGYQSVTNIGGIDDLEELGFELIKE